MPIRYWNQQNASNAWNATGPTNWGSASNTADNASVPTFSTDVLFDGVGGGANDCTVPFPGGVCRSLNFTGYANTFSIASAQTVFVGGGAAAGGAPPGNIGLKLVAGMTLTPADQSSGFSFGNTTTANHITHDFAGKVPGNVDFGGGYCVLVSDLTTLQTAPTNGSVRVSAGTLDTAGYAINCTGMINVGANAPTLILGSSVVTMSGYDGAAVWNFTTGGTVNAGTSTLKFTNTTNNPATFAGAGYTYNDVWFSRSGSTGTITITGNNTFHDFKDDGTGTHTITFPNGGTQHFSTWHVSGTAGHLISVQAASGTTTFTGDSASVFSADYLNLTNTLAGGSGMSWYAGANSTDSGGNTGWIFTAVPTNTGATALLMGV